MICGICLEIINKSVIGNCNHHFCYECLINWLKTKNTCPKCNNILYEINFDKEFDDIIRDYKNIKGENSPLKKNTINTSPMKNNNYIESIIEKKILIDFNKYKNEEIGITITNNSNGPGIKIKQIIQNKIAHKHNLKKGDVILFINNIPCINHKQTIEIIENLSLSYKNMELILL
jgi:hypothetical protein